MATTENPQTSLYETTIEDADLEKELEQRQKLKEDKGNAIKRFTDQNDRVKAKIAALDLGLGAPVRVGRFVISESQVAARAVASETSPTSRLNVSLLPEGFGEPAAGEAE